MLTNGNQIILITLIVLWTIPWKAVALWKAARNDSKTWFIILLVLNTLGILEIIYIFMFSKKAKQEEENQRYYRVN
jgi:hypothetical protein